MAIREAWRAARYGRIVGQAGGHRVRAVNGEAVRSTISIDFTQGGNSAIYPKYVPRGEIWFEKMLSPLDVTGTVLHELIEEWLMKRRKFSYDRAHDAANVVEGKLRAHVVAHGAPGSPFQIASRWYSQWLLEQKK
jgi:hypothetical protein